MENKAPLHFDKGINPELTEINHKGENHKLGDIVSITLTDTNNPITFIGKIIGYSKELRHNRIYILDSHGDSYDFIINDYAEIRKISTDDNNSLIDRIKVDFSNIKEIINNNNIEELKLLLENIGFQLRSFGLDFDKLKEPNFRDDGINETSINVSLEKNQQKNELLNNIKLYFLISQFITLRIKKLEEEKLAKKIKEGL